MSYCCCLKHCFVHILIYHLFCFSVVIQYTVEIRVPKMQHGMLLGKHASKIKQLEQGTNTKITVPRQDDSSDVVRISGNKEGVDSARQQILSFSEDLVCVFAMCTCLFVCF